ncbi:methyl-accepting chemotaxis protein [Thalassoglobus polymorphus]|uniref:Biofilm dispersion protein BdlA n=1 Tax=Thalassoglobus polymorphus TaxID=2527994 RepID=A0A517QP28_9PLAN|nr:methyl-accepting chemotaxis protein [Thalassoglobus polymorphus]QDT33373.1 Biofilm dispersion protein BdlA [Thalassoglobus polymorphus]
MTYRFRLFITHTVTALSAGGIVGLICQSPEKSLLMFYAMVLPLGVILPATMAVWWFEKAIRKIVICIDRNELVSDINSGIPELDELAKLVGQSEEWKREGRLGIQKVLEQLSPQSAKNGSSKKVSMDGRLLAQVLAKISRAVGAEVGRILTHIDAISNRADGTIGDAQDQTTTLDESIQNVEELSTNIDLILSNAKSANQSAIDAREAAVLGQNLIDKLIEGMHNIRAYVEAGERKVLSLGERSQEISSIVETMGTLSTRTDMLALNASIEAVRAGEEGRGFAIVAEEVRKLAEHTSTASREIADLVESIQMETQDTISAMAEQRTQVQEGVARVNEAGVALERISQTSTDSAERVGDISRITMNQLRGTQDMINVMQKVATLSHGIHQRATSVKSSAGEVVSVTKDLELWMAPMFNCDDEARQHQSDRGRELPEQKRENMHDREHLVFADDESDEV